MSSGLVELVCEKKERNKCFPLSSSSSVPVHEIVKVRKSQIKISLMIKLAPVVFLLKFLQQCSDHKVMYVRIE